MGGIKALRHALQSTKHLVTWFLNDLTDDELLVRPTDGANHIAWQMGHLITADPAMIREQIPDAVYPELPAGFDARYANTAESQSASTGFLSRAEYADLFTKVRDATIAALDKLTDADLDRPTVGNMAPYAPTLGDLFLLVSNHSLMHGGQFSVVRRKLGKPVLF
jgi:uncharacterized damage-inducible protein DinB